MEEKRRFRRFRATLDTKYIKVKGYVMIASSSTTNDIGLGGLCAPLSRVVKRGDEVLIELDSTYNRKKIATLTKVIWVRSAYSNRYYICGLKFLSLSSKPYT